MLVWSPVRALIPDGAYNGSIAYGNGVWVYVSSGATVTLETSTDLRTWTPRTPAGALGNVPRVRFLNGLFVLVGRTTTVNIGFIDTSPDGINWTRRAPSTATDRFFFDATFGDGAYVVVGHKNPGTPDLLPRIERSTDGGTTWAAQTPPVGLTSRLLTIAYGDGVFVAAGDGVKIRSTDGGVTWTSLAWAANTAWSLAYSHGKFILVGYTNTGEPLIETSSDGGATWTQRTSVAASGGLLRDVCEHGSLLVAVGQLPDGIAPLSETSEDGVAWASDVIMGPSVALVAVGSDGGSTLLAASSDGAVYAGVDETDYLEASPESCTSALESLLPQGAAWPRDPDTALMLLVRGLALEGTRVKQRALALIEENDPRTTTELLPDWERVYGLVPDPAATTAQRRAALHAKMLNDSGQTDADYRAIAAALGFPTVVFSFYAPFTCVSNCNDSLYTDGWRSVWMTTTASGGASGTADDAALVAAFWAHAQRHTTPLFTFT